MIYHVLNGDGLAGNFYLEGEIIVCREALIEGELRANNLSELWQKRADFIKKILRDETYFERVIPEFIKVEHIKSQDEVNLWFGNEAFCQVNLWLFLHLLEGKGAKVYRIFPDSEGWNCGFVKLEKCYELRQGLTEEDVQLGKKLWKSFCYQDFVNLKSLGRTESTNFPHLPEVCLALIEKDNTPKEILREIIQNGETDFGQIFKQFQAKAPIYGFGDLQVKNILKSI